MGNYPGLTTVTFTGPDDTTDIPALVQFQNNYPACEIGILYDPGQAGQPGFPSQTWLKAFIDKSRGRRSLHVCNEAIMHFLKRDNGVHKLAYQFGRVQLNIRDGSQFTGRSIADAAKRFHSETGGSIIVPMNPNNMHLMSTLLCSHVDTLFDRSQGTGVLAETYPNRISENFTAWAGGLGPDNIQAQMPKIAQAARRLPFGIDMESRVKGPNGHFAIALCDTVMMNLGF